MTENTPSPDENGTDGRCERCNRPLDEHAEVRIGSAGVTWICPTTEGYAVSEEIV